jgi:hypothetical protein
MPEVTEESTAIAISALKSGKMKKKLTCQHKNAALNIFCVFL